MPKVTIWIREENKEIFSAIKDRPEWLHVVINHPMTTTEMYLDKRPIGESIEKSSQE